MKADIDHGLPYFAAADLLIGGRAEQQDAVRLLKISTIGGREALLLLVADGMGGHAGGAIASSVATEAFVEHIFGSDDAPVEERLRVALECANQAIGNRVAVQNELKGMGCTLVAVIQIERHVNWISVGDTLLLEIHNGRAQRLNQDHSMAVVLDAQAERGEISWDEARSSPTRDMLRSALTGGPIALVDKGAAGLSASAFLMLATDGILSLSQATLADLGELAASPADYVDTILNAISADMAADQDNITVAVSKIPGAVTRPIFAVIPPISRRHAWPKAVFLFALAIVIISGALVLTRLWGR